MPALTRAAGKAAMSRGKVVPTFPGIACFPPQCPAEKWFPLFLELLWSGRNVLRKSGSHFSWNCLDHHHDVAKQEPGMSYETLSVETRDRVGLIRINRPQALNALNLQVMREMLAALAAFDKD